MTTFINVQVIRGSTLSGHLPVVVDNLAMHKHM